MAVPQICVAVIVTQRSYGFLCHKDGVTNAAVRALCETVLCAGRSCGSVCYRAVLGTGFQPNGSGIGKLLVSRIDPHIIVRLRSIQRDLQIGVAVCNGGSIDHCTVLANESYSSDLLAIRLEQLKNGGDGGIFPILCNIAHLIGLPVYYHIVVDAEVLVYSGVGVTARQCPVKTGFRKIVRTDYRTKLVYGAPFGAVVILTCGGSDVPALAQCGIIAGIVGCAVVAHLHQIDDLVSCLRVARVFVKGTPFITGMIPHGN